MAKQGKKNNQYSDEFKETVVKRYLNSPISYQSLADEYGIPSKEPIRNWVAKYLNANNDKQEAFRDLRGLGSSGKPKTKFNTPEEKIHWLEAQVELLKKIVSIERK